MSQSRNDRDTATSTLVIEFDSEEYPALFDNLEKNLKLIEENVGIKASSRGNRIFLKGDEKKVKLAEKMVRDLRYVSSEFRGLSNEDIRYASASVSEGGETSLKELFVNNIPVSSKRRFIIPKTETQKKYLDAIKET